MRITIKKRPFAIEKSNLPMANLQLTAYKRRPPQEAAGTGELD